MLIIQLTYSCIIKINNVNNTKERRL